MAHAWAVRVHWPTRSAASRLSHRATALHRSLAIARPRSCGLPATASVMLLVHTVALSWEGCLTSEKLIRNDSLRPGCSGCGLHAGVPADNGERQGP